MKLERKKCFLVHLKNQIIEEEISCKILWQGELSDDFSILYWKIKALSQSVEIWPFLTVHCFILPVILFCSCSSLNTACFFVPTHWITCVISLKKNKSVALVRETRKSSVGLIWILCSLCELAHLTSFLILYAEDWQGWQCFLVIFLKKQQQKAGN